MRLKWVNSVISLHHHEENTEIWGHCLFLARCTLYLRCVLALTVEAAKSGGRSRQIRWGEQRLPDSVCIV